MCDCDRLEHAAARYLTARPDLAVTAIRRRSRPPRRARGLWSSGRCSTGASTARRSCRSPARARDRRLLARRPAARRWLHARARRLRRRLARSRELWTPRRGAFPHRRPGQRRRRSARRLRGARHRRPRRHRRAAASRCTPTASARRRSTASATLRTVIAQRPGSTERDADPDRRPPRRRRRAGERANCRRPPRCWSWRACSPRARPSGRSCSPPPAAAAAATPAPRTASASCPGRLDAAIVLGDLAGTRVAPPARGALLRRLRLGARCRCSATVAGAINDQAGSIRARRARSGQLAHLVFPLAAGEQGVLDAAGSRRCSSRSPANGALARPSRSSAERLERLRPRRAERGRRARHRPADVTQATQNGSCWARQQTARVGAAAARARR